MCLNKNKSESGLNVISQKPQEKLNTFTTFCIKLWMFFYHVRLCFSLWICTSPELVTQLQNIETRKGACLC